MAGSFGESKGVTTLIPLAKAVMVGALILTLDASIQEFAELLSLSDNARRERFQLPPACTPKISAVKPAAPNAGRLMVFVDCSAPTILPSSPVEPTSWRDK